MTNKPIHRFFIMLICSAIGLLCIGLLRPKPISSVIQKDKFWATKVHSSKKYDVIFVGDSRFYRGIDPNSISEKLGGLDVLNFGFSSGGHNPIIFNQAAKRLKSTSKNKYIVLGLTPYSLTKKAQSNAHFMQEAERGEYEVFQRRFVNPTLSFFDIIKPHDFFLSNANLEGYYEDFKSNGWVESKKIPYNSEAALKSYRKDFKNNKIDSTVVNNVMNQVQKWTTLGIKVFALRMPTTSNMEKLENDLSGYEETKLKTIFEEAGGNWISYKDRYGYTTYDGSHLDGESAKKFSNQIGERLYDYLK